MVKIISLKGKADTGKTTTLRKLWDYLNEKKHDALEEIQVRTNEKFSIFHNCDGHTIGVFTQGDPGVEIAQALNTLIDKDCDIIFCACRTYGQTFRDVASFNSANCKVYFANKQVSDDISDAEICNEADVKRIMTFSGLSI